MKMMLLPLPLMPVRTDACSTRHYSKVRCCFGFASSTMAELLRRVRVRLVVAEVEAERSSSPLGRGPRWRPPRWGPPI